MTHWLLVGSVAGSYATSRSITKLFSWHKYCGYTVLILVSFRIVWGFVGTRYARFEEFLRTPRCAAGYLQRLRRHALPAVHIGHNPLGGWSVITMLVVLFAQAGTGLFANDDVSRAGPFFGWSSLALSNSLTRIHHLVFVLLEGFIFLHILAIGFYGYVRKVDLLKPMITGCKSAELVSASNAIADSRVLLAILIVVLLTIALVVGLAYAPATSLSIFQRADTFR
jgi:cytochrome b